jgi:endoglucanase
MDLKLNLPEDEAGNDLPDILDEALWNLAFYRRMQMPDGGVRGGIESTAHPRPGEASWQESLFVGAFAPDPVTSHLFAAKAAKWARVTADLRPDLAAEYGQAAIKAWDWAEANGRRIIEALDAEKKTGHNNAIAQLNTARNLAAVELYWLTGDAKYHEVFSKTTILSEIDRPSTLLSEQTALFTYARLPKDLGDATLKVRAKMFITTMADQGLTFAEGNSYGITSPDPGMPPMGWVGHFSLPGNQSLALPRAYVLTGEVKYLGGTVRAANFAAGCNPDNRALTTGVGHDPVRWPLHIDSRVSSQCAPRGITVCGQSDPAERYDFENWAHIWILGKTMTPDSRSWPAYEAYSDIGVLPSMNEYTIVAILHNAYTWGVLAARPERAD